MKHLTMLMLAAVVVGTPAAGGAQAPVADWLGEINRDVWSPYLQGVREDREDLYLDVHAPHYVRIQADSDLILSYPQYVEDTVSMMRRYRGKGVRIEIELRFEERIVNGASASEKGVSRVRFEDRDGKVDLYYGQFHAISTKDNGRWRILTEYFSAGGADEARFMHAHALGDLAPFRCYMGFPAKVRTCDARQPLRPSP